jgi:large subunit ribosomal protein L15
MKLHDLKPRPHAQRKRKRVGRGISAGQGKTAGRGTKGEGARAGSGGKLFRQGGNLPLFRKLPFKRGFTNIHRVQWQELNLDRIAEFEADSEIDPEALLEAGLIDNLKQPVVLLGRGDIDRAFKIKLHRVSQSAQEKIEAAGGVVELLEA